MNADELFRLAEEYAGLEELPFGRKAIVFATAELFAACLRHVNVRTPEYQSMSGMADCMAMVHSELIEAEIIPKGTPPMFVTEAVIKAFQHASMAANAEAKNADEWREKAQQEERHAKIAETKAAHWKANHDSQVDRARVLLERVDMPLERVNAYKLLVDMSEDFKRFQACRHGARSMPEDGGEEAFVLAIDKYRTTNGLE